MRVKVLLFLILFLIVVICNTVSAYDFVGVVLNLTFDNSSDPWKDYSVYNHVFNKTGTVSNPNSSVCKWYRCINFTHGEGNYINSTSQFELNETGFAANYWIYYRDDPDDAGAAAHWQVGKQANSDEIGVYDNAGGYGTTTLIFNSTGGQIYNSISVSSNQDQWYNIHVQFNPADRALLTYHNGVLMKNYTYPSKSIAKVLGKFLAIGEGRYASSPDGYIDEFLLYNKSNFTNTEILNIYNEKRLGTPPELDLYVKAIKYAKLINYSDQNNSLITGKNMLINFTIDNFGINDTATFSYNLSVDGTFICNGSTTLTAKTEINVSCNWSASIGFHKGYLVVDSENSISESNEENNYQPIYIPYLNRPYMLFNITEWYADLKPYALNSANTLAYNTYVYYSTFTSDDFTDSWDGDDVDPRAKKGRENVMTCLINDLNMSKEQCQRARRHLFGWANRTVTTYTDVQAVHELIHVGYIYDILYRNLTQSENELVASQLHDICQEVSNLVNIETDNADEIEGDNGKGFGSGMGGFCYSILGEYSENPMLIHELDQSNDEKNLVDLWMRREENYLRAYKNESFAQYQEGWFYKQYSEHHIYENFIYENKFNLNNLSKYQNAFNSMAFQYTYLLLDKNYDGAALRGDSSVNFRNIQRGDGNSYSQLSDGSFSGWDIILYSAMMTNNINYKSSLLYLRNMSAIVADSVRGLPSLYLMYPLSSYASKSPEQNNLTRVIFDNANDILTIRNNYSYVNDTIIMIDGGEERGGGHSQAQGYYLYALGEPFLDYEQVPYNDDQRDDTTKNGISLKNDTTAREGLNGIYNSQITQYGFNQFYGMQNASVYFSTDYPQFRQFPLQYGGDLEDYIGSSDTNFAGVFVWRPYYNITNNIKEYFIKVDNTLIKRTVVPDSNEGMIYHNFWNLYDEFGETLSGINITFNRTRWDNDSVYMDINTIYSNQTLTIGGGKTNITYCFDKTNCAGSDRGNGTYRHTYLYTNASNIDFIINHQWYYNNSDVPTVLVNNADKGVTIGNDTVIFDNDADGNCTNGTVYSTGWGMYYNLQQNKSGAFNTTAMTVNGVPRITTNNSISYHWAHTSSKITLTVNTMERDVTEMDNARSVNITLDTQELNNNTNLTVKKYSITGTLEETLTDLNQGNHSVSFIVQSDLNSNYFEITGNSTILMGGSAPATGSTTTQNILYTLTGNERVLFFTMIFLIIFGAIFALIYNPTVGFIAIILGATFAIYLLRSLI